MQHSPTLSRRRILALTGAASAGGVAYLTTQSDEAAAAEVELGGFSLQESEHIVGAVESVTIEAPISYYWQSPNGTKELRFQLLVGSSLTNLEVVTTETIAADATENEGSLTLSADLLSSWHFSTSDFEPSTESKEVLVAAGVRMELVDGDGNAIHETYDDDAGHILVHPEGELEAQFESVADVTIT